METSSKEPLAEDRWVAELALLVEEHQIDQLHGVDAFDLAEFMTVAAEAMVNLVKERDRGKPVPLDSVERSELAALRKVTTLQQVTIELEQQKVEDLSIRLKDLQQQCDRLVRRFLREDLGQSGVAPD